MFVCKICDKEYDDNMRYSRDSRYCKKCGAILAQKPVEHAVNCIENPSLPDNGGQILYG